MKLIISILAPFLLILGGCWSAPVPQELVDVGQSPPAEPILLKEVVRLSRMGISDEVIVGLVKRLGVADRYDLRAIAALHEQGVSDPVLLALVTSPPRPPEPKPAPRIVYRELFVPLWPAYSRGHWHAGLRIGCLYRTEERVQEIQPREEVEPAAPILPKARVIDP